MSNTKKSFLIYLDAYHYILTLPMEQRGELFTALFWYAVTLEEKGEQDAVAAISQFPNMSPDARMAFFFMANNIARDTRHWREKKGNYEAAARRRTTPKSGSPSEAPLDDAWKYV